MSYDRPKQGRVKIRVVHMHYARPLSGACDHCGARCVGDEHMRVRVLVPPALSGTRESSTVHLCGEVCKDAYVAVTQVELALIYGDPPKVYETHSMLDGAKPK